MTTNSAELRTDRRVTASALLLLGALALAGCATSPGGATPDGGAAQTATPAPGDADSDFDAAWLAGGTAIGLISSGSSSCPPIVGEVTGEGQTISVELTDPDSACTKDLVQRASYVGVPSGVDATQDVEIVVSGDYRGDVDIDGLAGAVPPASGDPADDPAAEMSPSAGWFDDGIVLLTYGSSSCPPEFASVAVSADGSVVDVALAEPDADQVCTMDYAPRLSVLGLDDVDDDARPAELVLTSTVPGVEAQRIALLG